MNLREAYESSLNRGTHDRDPAQEAIVTELEQLQQQLENAATQNRGWRRFLGSGGSSGDPVRGLYIWGGVGRGKTFLMDLFFENLDSEGKRRIHFHELMRWLRDRLQTS